MPNQAAIVLKKGGRARTIGFVIPSIADPFFSEAARKPLISIARAHDRDDDTERRAGRDERRQCADRHRAPKPARVATFPTRASSTSPNLVAVRLFAPHVLLLYALSRASKREPLHGEKVG